MIVPTIEPKLEDTALEPKEKDTPQPATRSVPTLTGYTNLQKLKIEGFLEQQSIIILIDTRSTHNFMSIVARPDYFIQPQKVKDKRVVQEMTETQIVRPCLFPAMTRPYILFPGDKLLLKCYILLNSPWLLMQHFHISGDFNDFPQDRTMMLKDFLDEDLRSMAQDREKIEPLQ
ncbi:hypothetical protein BHE74_00046541 [Ensete ventricosum]|nr:hypothetical protein GW17_00025425 [Ensete ventricosum]RWW47458.1 hypothetical protein BHE74_00046541 [Ensete ventricosum]